MICPDLGDEGIKRDILEYVNEARANGIWCGDKYCSPVQPLKWNDKLSNAAMRHSQDQAKNEFLGHTGSDGSEAADRINDTGYIWSSCGENVGYGNADKFGQSSKGAVKGWLESPEHCANIMNPAFTEIGVASVRGGCDDCDCLYWTMNFGSPK